MIRPPFDPLQVERHPTPDLRAWRAELTEQVRLLLRHTLYLGLSPVYRANRRAAVRVFHARVAYVAELLDQGLLLVQEGEDAAP